MFCFLKRQGNQVRRGVGSRTKPRYDPLIEGPPSFPILPGDPYAFPLFSFRRSLLLSQSSYFCPLSMVAPSEDPAAAIFSSVDAVARRRLALRRSVSHRSAKIRLAPLRSVPLRLASCRLEPPKKALLRTAFCLRRAAPTLAEAYSTDRGRLAAPRPAHAAPIALGRLALVALQACLVAT